MNLSVLLPLLDEITEYRELISRLSGNAANAESIEVLESARPFVLAGVAVRLARPMLVIAGRADRGKELLLELQAWVGVEKVEYFSEPDPLLYERVPWSPDTISGRLAALSSLLHADGEPRIIVSTVRALLPYTMPPDLFRKATRTLRQGDTAALDSLLSHWVEIGYEPTAVVDTPGSVSRRGGIIDIWPPAEREPVRVEFVGDQIETLRVFDPGTQRSSQVVNSLIVTPASEALLADAERVSAAVRELDLSKMHPVAASTFRQDQEALANHRRLRGIEFYIPYYYSEPFSLVQYLPADAVVAVDDWQEIEQAAQQFEAQAEEVRRDLEGRGEAPPGLRRPYFTWNELRAQLMKFPRLLFDFQSPMDLPRFPFVPGPRYGGQIRKVTDELVKWRKEHARGIVVSRQSERLAELLREENIFVKPHEELKQIPDPGHVALVRGALTEGWLLPLPLADGNRQAPVERLSEEIERPDEDQPAKSENVLHFLTDAEIFGWTRPRQRRPGTARHPHQVSPEAFFADLAAGDYVVHVDHGIGVFRGLQKMDLGGGEREYLLIEYGHGD
ncbi:MAG: CarD family transcriptional regulator, partial [Rudaea sp.]